MSKWTAIVKGAKYMVNNPATRSLGGAIVHPTQTLRGVGTATKSAVVGAGVGYAGWQYIVNDQSVARTASEVLIGEQATDTVSSAISGTVETVRDVTSNAAEAIAGVNETTQQARGMLDGISDFLRNIFGGGAGNMFGNFFANIGRGNVSGMSIVGLLASAMLIFGRWGWLGKIGGLLLGMLLIGNNSRVEQQTAPTTQEQQTQGGGMRR